MYDGEKVNWIVSAMEIIKKAFMGSQLLSIPVDFYRSRLALRTTKTLFTLILYSIKCELSTLNMIFTGLKKKSNKKHLWVGGDFTIA